MPIYEYEPVSESCDQCEGRFELARSMNDPEVSFCPDCGQECRRIYSSFSVGKGPSSSALSTDNLARHGFTQYKKSDNGSYEKSAGEGPERIYR